MRAIPIASTNIRPEGWDLFEEFKFNPFSKNGSLYDFSLEVSDGDILGEFAGRNCYESFHKPNPDTAENKAYLNNILEIEHESILEHASVSFYVSGVSRNVLLELERHRHLSYSVISTRYVSPEKMGVVIHPNTPESIREAILLHDTAGRMLADKIYMRSRAEGGYGVKESREIARQVLGGNTETKMVVTGNLRAWRYVVNLRWHPKADKEIQLLAEEILKGLKKVAPNSVQDFPNPEDIDA